MIVVISSGGSNLGSVVSAFERLGESVLLSDDPQTILEADRVVLPGVGHAGAMMQRLSAKGLHKIIPQITRPLLGICLGMQILFEHSEEGDSACLGIIPGRVIRIPELGLPVPHMGWNHLESRGTMRNVIKESIAGEYFYFVHSYCAEPGPWVHSICDYGCEIPSFVQWKNFYGTQFHPERSGEAGTRLLSKFLCET